MKKKQTEAKLSDVLGARVAGRRKQLKWSQQKLAERVGVDAETISRFERGVNLPSLLTLEKLAGALNCEIGDLLTNPSLTEMPETTKFAAWIADMSPKDREFLMNVVKSCCDHLAKR